MKKLFDKNVELFNKSIKPMMWAIILVSCTFFGYVSGHSQSQSEIDTIKSKSYDTSIKLEEMTEKYTKEVIEVQRLDKQVEELTLTNEKLREQQNQ